MLMTCIEWYRVHVRSWEASMPRPVWEVTHQQVWQGIWEIHAVNLETVIL